MKIALDFQAVQGQAVGLGRYAAGLMSGLRNVAPENEYLTLHRGRETPMRLPDRLFWQQWRLPRRARGADVLHVPGFDAPWLAPCPVVLTVHDLIGLMFPQNLPPVSRFYWSKWVPWSIRAARVILANSQTTRRDLVRRLGLRPESIRVAHPAAEPRFKPQPESVLDKFCAGLGLKPRYILYVGTIEPRKGVDILIQALNLLPGPDLVLAGKDGWGVDRILRGLNDPNLAGRVHRLGWVPDQDLPALYGAAAVLTLPSQYEGFGLPVLEAMACGVPVVCSDAGALPEVTAGAARLIPPGDARALAQALAAVLGSRDLQTELKEKGLTRARVFSWEQTARIALEAYREAAGA